MNPAHPTAPATDRFLVGLGLAIVLAGLALRLPALNLSLWVDEVGSLTQANAADFWATARHDVHPPLYYLVLRGEGFLTASVPLLRLFSVGCGLALGALGLRVFRFSRAGAAVAGILAVFSPGLFHHSLELRQYALLYFLLGLALLLAVRLAGRDSGRHTQIGLALVLATAAATHLVTLFFLVALLPFLVWPVRQLRFRGLPAALWPLLPALLLLLWFKFVFVTQPHDLAEGWWIAPVDLQSVLGAFAEASGWANIEWLGAAVARQLPVPAWLLPAGAAGLAGLTFAAAWRPQTDFLSRLLLGSAVGYWAAVVAYSCFFEPIVLARTLLPGFLIFFSWLAWGIGQQAHPGWRRGALAATLGYSALALVLPLRALQHPAPGLRGMAGEMRANYRPGDVILSVHGLDAGLRYYWPQAPDNDWVRLDFTHPLSGQLDEVAAALRQAPAGHRVWVAYRDDIYYQRSHLAFAAVVARITPRLGALQPYWQDQDLVLRVAGPATTSR